MGWGKSVQSTKCRVQRKKQSNVRIPTPVHLSFVKSFELFLPYSDTPIPPYQLFPSPVSLLSLLNSLLPLLQEPRIFWILDSGFWILASEFWLLLFNSANIISRKQ